MWPRVFRICALSITVLAVTAGQSAGDPVVLTNGSGVSGELSLGTGSSAISTFYLNFHSLPTGGVGTVQDGRVLNVGDMRVTSSAELTTSISPLMFSGTGGAGVDTADSTSAGLPNAFAMSQLVIEFTLAEARAFTYTGRYFGRLDESSDGIVPEVTPAAGGVLYRVFNIDPNTTATVTYLRDDFLSLFTEQLTQHSGILDPGRYFLQARASGRLFHEPNMRITAGYAVTLTFAPEPVPEPATVLLATSGLTAVLAVARRRRRVSSTRTVSDD